MSDSDPVDIPDEIDTATASSQPTEPATAADPLLAQAEALADLPLGERAAELGRLNAALVAELNALEEV